MFRGRRCWGLHLGTPHDLRCAGLQCFCGIGPSASLCLPHCALNAHSRPAPGLTIASFFRSGFTELIDGPMPEHLSPEFLSKVLLGPKVRIGSKKRCVESLALARYAPTLGTGVGSGSGTGQAVQRGACVTRAWGEGGLVVHAKRFAVQNSKGRKESRQVLGESAMGDALQKYFANFR